MIEVLKQALTDAKRNERHNNVAETRYWLNQYKLIAEQAIKELESQEPVAYLCENAVGHKYFRWKKPTSIYKPIALYTHPPQRTWVGLTDEEIWQIATDSTIGGDLHADKFAKAIESKLKERNG